MPQLVLTTSFFRFGTGLANQRHHSIRRDLYLLTVQNLSTTLQWTPVWTNSVTSRG